MGIKLLVSAPVPTDATSFYRAVDPLNELRREIDLDILSFSDPNWNAIAMSDMVFLQRPYLPQQVELIHMAKKMGRPVWCDWDDLLTSVPVDNPTHEAYSQAGAQINLKECIRLADVITTSTEALAAGLRKHSPDTKAKFIVVPNALNMRYFQRYAETMPTNPIVVWRGSPTHTRDLMEYSDEIMRCYETFPDWRWFFMGFKPYWLFEKMNDPKRCLYHGWVQGPIDLVQNMQRVRGALHIVPLHNSPFNHAKSRISELEATLAGSVVLGPNWTEWDADKMPRYKDAKHFGESLKDLMKTPLPALQELNKAHWNWISENRTLARTNLLRKDIIADFLGNRYVRA